jgi:hypothetical protein
MGWEVSPVCAMRSVSRFNPMFCRMPYAILDHERRIIAVLAGRPYSKNGVPDGWDGVVARACTAIEAAREEMHFDEGDVTHRRGPHIGKACGWSHGHGQQV